MSTPKAGGMIPLTALSKGCVGMTNSSQGISVTSVSGYQDKTTRANMATHKKFRNGSNTAAVGWTQACVSAIVNVDVSAVVDGSRDVIISIGIIIVRLVPLLVPWLRVVWLVVVIVAIGDARNAVAEGGGTITVLYMIRLVARVTTTAECLMVVGISTSHKRWFGGKEGARW